MPRLSAAKMKDRRDAILDAARAVFGRKGYAEASISDIAGAANVSDGLVYRYFEDGKRELLSEVLRDFYGAIIASSANAVRREATLERKLCALVSHHLQAFAEEPALCRLFITEVRALHDYPGSPIQSLNRDYTSIFRGVLAWGAERGLVPASLDTRLVRDLLFGGIEHFAWRHLGRGEPLDVPAATDRIVRLLMHGLVADHAS